MDSSILFQEILSNILLPAENQLHVTLQLKHLTAKDFTWRNK